MPAPLSISIPQTSTSTDPTTSKPYTLYHVNLALPIRIHETRKRYSDFLALHTALIQQVGSAPPAPLPAKSWLRRTVNNAALTESRRATLEAYLGAILTAEDGRWRASSAWRAFLDLPGTNNTNTNGSSSSSSDARTSSSAQQSGQAQKQRSNAPDTAITDANQWLDVHRDVKTQLHTARALLSRRAAAPTAQEQHAVSAEAKGALVRAAVNISRLEDSLTLLSRGRGGGGGDDDDDDDGGWGGGAAKTRLGDGEVRRRRDLLGAAKKEVEALDAGLKALVIKSASSMLNAASAGAAATDADKEALWRGMSSTTTSTAAASSTRSSMTRSMSQRTSSRVLGGGPPLRETERTRELGNQGVLQLQQQIMREQEEDVLEIGKAVSRMKDMGIMINEELVVQNQMLGLLDQDVDRVESKVGVAKKRIMKIS